MTISWFRYVRHADVPAREAEGWRIAADLGPTHGLWSVLMQWSRSGSPPGEETDLLDAAAANNESEGRRDDQRPVGGDGGGTLAGAGDCSGRASVGGQHRDGLHQAAN